MQSKRAAQERGGASGRDFGEVRDRSSSGSLTSEPTAKGERRPPPGWHDRSIAGIFGPETQGRRLRRIVLSLHGTTQVRVALRNEARCGPANRAEEPSALQVQRFRSDREEFCRFLSQERLKYM